jgi:hypothetical protein
MSGKLDTGFISRFNERRAAQDLESSEVEEDLAVIAAALSYAARQQQPSIVKTSQSRWKLALSSNWRKS